MENIESKVEKLSLGEDDVLVIFVPHAVYPTISKFYKERIPELLPYGNNILVLPDTHKLAVIEKRYKSLWDMETL